VTKVTKVTKVTLRRDCVSDCFSCEVAPVLLVAAVAGCLAFRTTNRAATPCGDATGKKLRRSFRRNIENGLANDLKPKTRSAHAP
jgi:hypothetical protein